MSTFYDTLITGNGVNMSAGDGTQTGTTITVLAVSTEQLELNAVYDISGTAFVTDEPVNFSKATYTKAVEPAIAEFTIS